MALDFSRISNWLGLAKKRAQHTRRVIARACHLEPLESRELLSLTVDIRLPDGGKVVDVTGVGQVINMEIWATVRGSNTTGDDEALAGLIGSFLSTNVSGGSALGTLKATLDPVFTGSGAYTGDSTDLDGDGDLDLGSNDHSSASGFFVARAPQGTSNGIVDGDRKSFKVGTLKFTVTQVLSGQETRINFSPYNDQIYGLGGLWVEDGSTYTASNGTLQAWKPVVLRGPVASDSTPPAARLVASPLTDGGGPDYTFSVDYTDNLAVKLSSLGDEDLVVIGPNGKKVPLSFVGANRDADNATIRATYRVSAPGQYWDSIDNGTYTVKLAAKQVSDLSGNFAAATTLGTFAVNVPNAVIAKGQFLVINGTEGDDNIAVWRARRNTVAQVGDTIYKFSRTQTRRVYVLGHGGDDTILLWKVGRRAWVDGGAGNDTITGTDVGETLRGGDGNDSIIGNGGDDVIYGDRGNDVLRGGDGNDLLDGKAGRDSMYGDAGNDRLFGNDNDIDFLDGGAGTDTGWLGTGDKRANIEVLK